MAVTRWQFVTLDGTDSFTFEQNPKKMTSPYRPKNIVVSTTTAVDGQALLVEAQTKPTDWTFQGALLTQTMHDAMVTWVNKRERIYLYDHYSRQMIVYLTQYDWQPRNSTNWPWAADYTMHAYVLQEPMLNGVAS